MYIRRDCKSWNLQLRGNNSIHIKKARKGNWLKCRHLFAEQLFLVLTAACGGSANGAWRFVQPHKNITDYENDGCMYGRFFKHLTSVHPRHEAVNPTNGKAEPAVFSYRLASETEDKVAVGVGAGRESGIEKTEMGTAFVVGMKNGVPKRYVVWM